MAHIKENLARFGMISKGVVYVLIGILTALTAFNHGGQTTGSKGSLKFMASQSYGQILLVILGLGLVAYALWRLFQAFGNHDKFNDDALGYTKRFAYFISALIYGALSFYALQLVNDQSASSNNSLNMSESNFGSMITLIIGIGIAIKAIYDFYRAYSKKFREDIDELKMGNDEKQLLLNTGRLGHSARGIVLGIMAYLTISSYNDIGKQTEAFHLIEQNAGTLSLGMIALGLACYGIYMFIKAKYPDTVIQ